jgi:hypothetical protein
MKEEHHEKEKKKKKGRGGKEGRRWVGIISDYFM